MTPIQLAKNKSDFKTIANLASQIWHQHYTAIIGIEQVGYMIEKFQSVAAIEAQIQKNYRYFILLFGEKPVGYLSIIPKDDALFLSKIYVLSANRGLGLGKLLMNFVNEKATALGLSKIALTVNKNNENSIKAYEKMGFKNVASIVTDIGGGFVMDDYVMEKKL